MGGKGCPFIGRLFYCFLFDFYGLCLSNLLLQYFANPSSILQYFAFFRRQAHFYLLSYILAFNLYVAEVFRYGLEFGGILVFVVFMLPVVFSFLLVGSLNSSVDFYYSVKSVGLRLYIFSGLFSYRGILKDWSAFLLLLFLYL